MIRARALGAALLILGMTGCTTPPPPLLTLGARACDSRPALADAVVVPFNDADGGRARLDGTSRCLDLPQGGGQTTYAAFRLPDAQLPSSVTITSLVERGGAIVSPRVTVMSASGAVLRVIEPGEFQASIEGLRAGLRTRPGERYVIVAADPRTLGEPLMLRLGLLSRSMRAAKPILLAMAGPVFVPIFIPPANIQPTQRATTRSLSGIIRVTDEPVVIAP